MPIYKGINKDFFKIWSPEMAYILGFFAADGYLTLNNRGANFWNIQITDRELLEEIKRVIKSEHKISLKKGKDNEKDLHRIQIGSKEMCNDLRILGMKENKTKSLSVPNVPNKYFADFVRGYFDGDGCVFVGLIHKERKTKYLNIQVIFTSCSKDFLEQLRSRLENRGIFKGRIQNRNNSFYRLVYSVSASLKLYKFMYNDKNRLFLERKKLIFDDYIKCARGVAGLTQSPVTG
jgi:intein-encoded DNA endonuclease-like protein